MVLENNSTCAMRNFTRLMKLFSIQLILIIQNTSPVAKLSVPASTAVPFNYHYNALKLAEHLKKDASNFKIFSGHIKTVQLKLVH